MGKVSIKTYTSWQLIKVHSENVNKATVRQAQ